MASEYNGLTPPQIPEIERGTMARSLQRGSIVPEGGSWVGFMNMKIIDPETGKEKWKKKPIGVLGSRSRMSKKQAREELDTEIAKQAGRRGEDVQGMLRHSRTATTTDVYMQEIPEGVEGVDRSSERGAEAQAGIGCGWLMF